MKRKHEGLHLNRLSKQADNPREVAFANRWKIEAPRVMDRIVDPSGTHSYDAVAATVTQWLGSNVGMSFLREALGDCGYLIVEKTSK